MMRIVNVAWWEIPGAVMGPAIERIVEFHVPLWQRVLGALALILTAKFRIGPCEWRASLRWRVHAAIVLIVDGEIGLVK